MSAPASIRFAEDLAPPRQLAGPRLDTLLAWGGSGFWAVLDQALFAGSNLLVNVLLARMVTPAEYGAFVSAYAVLLLIGVVHGAFFVEPMLVFGAGRFSATFSRYLDVLQAWHWRASIVVVAVFAAAGLVLRAGGLPLAAQASIGLAAATPSILFSWLARRACYAASRPQWAALAGFANAVCIIGGLIALRQWGALSVLTALLLLAAVALLSATCMLMPLRRLTTAPLEPVERAQIRGDHLAFGRWLCGTGLLNWGSGYIFYLVLPVWGDLAASGSLKAAMNLIMPVLQSDSALITLLTPSFVRSRQAGRLRRTVRFAAAGFAVEALLYGLLLLMFGDRLARFAYGGTYHFSMTTFAVLAAIPLMNSHLNVLGAALRVRQQTRAVFWAATASVLVIGTLGLAAMAKYGTNGALVATLLGCVAQIAVMLGLLANRRAPYPDAGPREVAHAHA